MNLGELIGEDPMLEARRVWARRGKKVADIIGRRGGGPSRSSGASNGGEEVRT